MNIMSRSCCFIRVLRPTNSYGHTETGPRFKVSSERLEKPGFELTTPGLQGGWLNHYTKEASMSSNGGDSVNNESER